MVAFAAVAMLPDADVLAFKFGDLDEDVQAAVRAASTEQITAWSTRLIEGTLTLDDVTG